MVSSFGRGFDSRQLHLYNINPCKPSVCRDLLFLISNFSFLLTPEKISIDFLVHTTGLVGGGHLDFFSRLVDVNGIGFPEQLFLLCLLLLHAVCHLLEVGDVTVDGVFRRADKQEEFR